MSSTTAPPPDPPDDDDDFGDFDAEGNPGPNPDDRGGSPRPGRPTKLTAKTAEAFVALLLQGQFRSTACRCLNISPRTFRRWMTSGRKFGSGVYGNFYRAVVSAEAETEAKAVADILQAGRELDPKLLVWWLERKFPQRWGRQRDELQELKRQLRDLSAEVRAMAAADGDGPAKEPVG